MEYEQAVHLEKQRAYIIRKLFNTPDGKIVLDYLRREYRDDPIDTIDPIAMARKVGSRDVVLNIEHVLKNTDEDFIDVP